MNEKKLGWIGFASVSFGTLMATLDSSAVNVALPAISRDFDAAMKHVQWVVASYFLTASALLLPMGRVGDLWGKNRLFKIGFFIFIVSALFCSLAQTLNQLIFLRIAQGIGAAIVMSLSPAILVDAFPSNERGKAMGFMGTIASIGLLSGAPISGFLTHYFSWRSVFFINIPIGLIGLLWAAQSLPPDLKPDSKNETKKILPDLSLFKDRFFAIGNLSLLLHCVSLFILYYLAPFFLAETMDYSQKEVGLMMMAIPFAFAISTPLFGTLSDKIGYRVLVPGGLFFLALAYFWFGLTNLSTSQHLIFLKLFCVGLAGGLFQAPNNSGLMGAVPRHHLGTAAALIATMRTFGTLLGVSLGTAIFMFRVSAHNGFGSTFSVHDLPAKLFLQAFQDTMWISAAIVLAAMALSFIRYPSKNNAGV